MGKAGHSSVWVPGMVRKTPVPWPLRVPAVEGHRQERWPDLPCPGGSAGRAAGLGHARRSGDPRLHQRWRQPLCQQAIADLLLPHRAAGLEK